MNVYDFDKTIYDGDSTIDFYFFCLRNNPRVLLCLPHQILAAIKYKMGRINKTQFKEEFYSFFRELENIDENVKTFWDANAGKVKEWYKNCQDENDLIISASPYFLLSEICERIGVHNLIASEVDKKSGKFTGMNCFGEEKVRRYHMSYSETIDNFFSDSKSDQPMADISRRKYIVKGDRIIEWDM